MAGTLRMEGNLKDEDERERLLQSSRSSGMKYGSGRGSPWHRLALDAGYIPIGRKAISDTTR